MKPIVAMVAALVLLASLRLAQARQAANEPVLPDGKPTEVDQLDTGSDRIPRFVYVARAGYGPLKEPKENAEVLPFNKDGKRGPVPFLEQLYVAKGKRYADYQVGARTYHLLVRYRDGRVTSVVGYFDTRFLIEMEAIRDRTTKLHEKVFLVTSPATLEKDKAYAEEVPYYDTPVPTAKTEPKGRIRLQQIYFVYGDQGSHKDGHVCVGREEIVDRSDPASTIVGWIPKIYTIRWNTREAFDWHSRSTLPGATPLRKGMGMVFRNRKHAYDALNVDRAPSPVHEEFREPGKPYTGMTRYEIRYPVLSYEDPAQEREDEEANISKYPELVRGPKPDEVKNRLRRVAVYSGAVDPKTGKPIKGLDQKKLAELRTRLKQIEEEALTAEIIFVVDKTQSMHRAGAAVADAFKKVVESARKGGGRRVRLAMAYYRDVQKLEDDPETVVQASELAEFDQARFEKVTRELRDEKDYLDGGDPEELVFYGLKKGIRTAVFGKNSRKIVVLIGDAGNKKDQLLHENKSPSLEDIVRELNPRGPKPLPGEAESPPSPMTLIAIQVIDPEGKVDHEGRPMSAAKREAFRAFKSEAEEIVRQSQKEMNRRFKDYSAGRYVLASETSKIQEAVLECFAALEREQMELRATIRKLEEGDTSVLTRSKHGPELLRMLRERGVEDQIKLLSKVKGAQLSEVGYVWDRGSEGMMQIAPCVLVTDPELREVVRVLRTLPKLHAVRTDRDKLIDSLVAIQAGEYPAGRVLDISRDRLTLNRLGLKFQSPLFQKPIKELLEDPKWDDHLQVFREKAQRLEDMLHDRYRNWPPGGLKVGAALPEALPLNGKTVQTQPRYFFLGGGERTKWFWVDLETEWP